MKTRGKRKAIETEDVAKRPRQSSDREGGRARLESAGVGGEEITQAGSGCPKPTPKRNPKEGDQDVIMINRAPVLTLWAAVVAHRQGRTWDEALTLGRWVSGTLAQSKGKALGIYEEHEKSEEEVTARHHRNKHLGMVKVDAFGMHIPTLDVGGKCHAMGSDGKAISPKSVQTYLARAFGSERLEQAKNALEGLAASVPLQQLGSRCYPLYEAFRPAWKGWGEKAELKLSKIRELASEA